MKACNNCQTSLLMFYLAFLFFANTPVPAYYMLSFSNIMHFLLFDNFDKPEMKLFYQIWYNFGKLRPQIDPSFPSCWVQKPKLLKNGWEGSYLMCKVDQ